MKPFPVLLILSCFAHLCDSVIGEERTPEVTNANAYQEATAERLVRITYDLAIPGGGTADVWVLISDNGGQTYSIVPKTLSGDVGLGITPGSGKQIFWDPMADLPYAYGTDFRAKVTASTFDEITITLPGDVPLVLVRIPPGSFLRGSTDDPSWSWCYPCEQPVHEVDIGYDFLMGKFEVTQAQWLAVMGNNPSHFPGEDRPVEQISWDDICRPGGFLERLNALGLGGTFRLPSEAEWEYACRAGTTTRYYFGDSDCEPTACPSCELSGYAWWCGNSQFVSHPVGRKMPNGFGLYDMYGNVWEWCQDRWHDDYHGAPTDGSAWESGDSPYRVIRGGKWDRNARRCRSADRGRRFPNGGHFSFGFRLVMTP